MTALAAALALVIGGTIGSAGHGPGRSSTWADIRSWVGFSVIVINRPIGVSLQRIQEDMADHPVDHLGGRRPIRIGNEATDRLTPVLTSRQLGQV